MFRGAFKRNHEGRHVLHQLAEDLRSPWYTYSRALWRKTAWITHLRVGLDTRTTGPHPPKATCLHMACKQEWKAKGCQPSDQVWAVDFLLHLGADPLAVSPRGDTVLMEVAGAGHVNMFNYLCHRTRRRRTAALEFKVTNCDRRNLWSIAGMAQGPGEKPRKDVNPAIQKILRGLVKENIIEPHGLTTRSSAARGARKLRIEDQKSDEAPCEFPDAGSSQRSP